MAEQVTKTIIVKADVADVYNIWSDFENFPHFMSHVKSVKKLSDRASEWTVTGPLGTSLTWNAEMTRDEENKRIAWSSKDKEGSLTTSGQVTFNNLPEHQTEVTVLLQYNPPAGKAGEVVARLFANPEQKLQEDLRNFKSFAEGMYDRTAKHR
ncbi:MAG TPA: SRPBCC family protein [Candidatus Sulfomarinibacteraceae bacterium]|nr:SRPBCC family protein [Candidatus Sulfomarinibacteraceae bacterium]